MLDTVLFDSQLSDSLRREQLYQRSPFRFLAAREHNRTLRICARHDRGSL